MVFTIGKTPIVKDKNWKKLFKEIFYMNAFKSKSLKKSKIKINNFATYVDAQNWHIKFIVKNKFKSCRYEAFTKLNFSNNFIVNIKK